MHGRRDLSIDHLMRSAQAVAGCGRRFGEGDIRLDGLRRLLDDISPDRQQDLATSQTLRLNLSRLVAASIAVDDDQEVESAGSKRQEEAPLFVIGFGRTGSTFIHNLLSLDSKAHAPRLWELWYPAPHPRPERYSDDSRIALTRSMLDHFDKVSPQIQKIHPMRPESPDECNHLILHTTHLAMMYDAPGYWAWLKQLNDQELGTLFSHYKTQVDYLQRFFVGRRWVSKALTHLHYLPALFDVFPNAKVIRLHRDPAELVPSLCSLYASLRKLFQTTVNPVDVGVMVSDVFADGMDRMVRSDKRMTPDNCMDVQFSDLIARPLETVADIYGRFGYEWTTDVSTTLEQYVAAASKAMRSQHSYDLEQFGLTRQCLIERSAPYLSWLQERAGIRLID